MSQEPRIGEGGRAKVFVLRTPGDLARAAAGRLWGIARERTATGPVHIALSGGETPRKAYETLSGEPYRTRFPWDAVHFWQVDERFVPAGDPRSNRRMIEETLLSRAPVPSGHFHGVDTSLPDAAAAAKAYEAALRRAFPGGPRATPRFDAVVLGIGADGHTASLFPGNPSVLSDAALALAATGGDPPLPRVSISLALINGAARVIFLVQGRGKAAVLREIVAASRDASLRSPALPAGLVAPRRGSTIFLADEEAAGLLPPSWRSEA
ncbi:MAG: 6-phosphogluconolactonase [Verrucomicrobiota bacterium]